MAVRDDHRRFLDEQGWVNLEGFVSAGRRDRLVDRIEALFAAEGAADPRTCSPTRGSPIRTRSSSPGARETSW